MIPNKVKLVIWDLDETFWRGTLSEEGIVAVESNIKAVRELSGRGIVNSICSKNDFDRAKAKLIELDIWDHFVFPSISFNPKGKAVAEMIEDAALRAENVLFLDDNRLNLEEVKFFNPGIMVAHPDDVLDGLLDHENFAGKPDPELTRLKQYQFLQRKIEERSSSALSNEEFLRASDIRVAIDYDIEANLDRVLDLINRSNQLNYTKKRLETPEAIADFRENLSLFGVNAGCVRAFDRYGDYGLIGFFMVKRRFKKNKAQHFVFSCRTMNMGIEQYIYEMLGCPDVEIAEPVSYGLQSHPAIDWITQDDGEATAAPAGSNRKFLLLGGCDLLQLATFCSADRMEFVNACTNGSMVRYDDPGFILSDRVALKKSDALPRFEWWNYEDALRFDAALAGAEILLVSLWAAMNFKFVRGRKGTLLGMTKSQMDTRREADPELFDDFEEIPCDDAKRIRLIRKSFQAIADKRKPDSKVFILGVYTTAKQEVSGTRRRKAFNELCRTFCEKSLGSFFYVDPDALIPREEAIGIQHYTRAGYHRLAKYILDLSGSEDTSIAMASQSR